MNTSIQRMTIKDCCAIIAGQSPESKYYNTSGEGIPFFQGKADFGELYPQIRTYCSQPIKIAEKDDILLSVRAPVGPTNLAPCRVCIGRGLTAIRPSEKLLTKYLLLFFRYFEMQLASKGNGTTFKAITQDVIKNLEVPVPTISEQERIVEQVEELLSKLDNGKETLEKAKAQLAVYRQAVLQEAFDGHLTDAQSKGNYLLSEFIEPPHYGTSKKCTYEATETSIPVYRIPNIDYQAGRIRHDDIKYTSFSDSELRGLTLNDQDILMIRSNGSASLVGRAALVTKADTGGTYAGYLIRLRMNEKKLLLPRFLQLFLNSHVARLYIETKAKSTSGVHNINSREISALKVPYFTKDQQIAIIDAIESRLSICDNITKTIDLTLQQAETLRQSVLKQAFEGRLNGDS